MLHKILFAKITDPAANLIWLFVLWFGIYAFTVWNHANWHWCRWSPNYGELCCLTGLILLTAEFGLNFPVKSVALRIFFGLAASGLLIAAIPAYHCIR